MQRFSWYLAVVIVNVLVCIISLTYATPMGFTDDISFELAVQNELISPLRAVNFDNRAAGTIVSNGDSVEGIGFHSDFGGVEMIIADDFVTTSPRSFLGTNDGGVFQDGDITLTADGAMVPLDGSANQLTLPDGSNVFCLGPVDSMNSFSSASVVADGGSGGPFFLYNVDNIIISAVREPNTVILLLIGLIGTAISSVITVQHPCAAVKENYREA